MTGHDCIHEQDFRELYGKVNETYTTVKLIDQSIRGNGQPGINQRLSTMETEVRNLRDTKIAIFAGVSAISIVAGGVGSVITFVITKLYGG